MYVFADVVTIARLFPSDYLHTLNQGIVAYLLGWTLQMMYVLPLLDEDYKGLPGLVTALIQQFPAHNSFHPIKHKRFDDITSLIKQERKVLKPADIYFGNTDIVVLTESWKLMTGLFQLLFAICTGNVFPSNLNWGKKVGITDTSFNMERCFINAIVSCVEVYWYADAQNLRENQIETYRNIISNAQSHIVVLHHVRVLVLNQLSLIAFKNAQKYAKQKESAKVQLLKGSKQLFNSSKKKLDKKFSTTKVALHAKLGKRFTGTYKFHLLHHLPDQVKDFGCIKENVDSSIMESTNTDMTDSFERTTKRFESTCREMLSLSHKKFHIQTSILLAKDTMTFSDDEDDNRTSIQQTHTVYFVSSDNKKIFCVKRNLESKTWDLSKKKNFPWHPLFLAVSDIHYYLYFFYLLTICFVCAWRKDLRIVRLYSRDSRASSR